MICQDDHFHNLMNVSKFSGAKVKSLDGMTMIHCKMRAQNWHQQNIVHILAKNRFGNSGR